jgi:hypothetical protein
VQQVDGSVAECWDAVEVGEDPDLAERGWRNTRTSPITTSSGVVFKSASVEPAGERGEDLDLFYELNTVVATVLKAACRDQGGSKVRRVPLQQTSEYAVLLGPNTVLYCDCDDVQVAVSSTPQCVEVMIRLPRSCNRWADTD